MTVLSTFFRRMIEIIAASLLVGLAVVVVVAVFCRYVLNDSLPWYDEVASAMLAWITYFGAALASLRRAHLGFSALVKSLPPLARKAVFILSEAITYTVFIALAWAGWKVLAVMGGMTLESLPWVTFKFVQAIVPVGCGLIILAQIFSTPLAWQRVVEGRDAEADEIATEIARAEAELARTGRER